MRHFLMGILALTVCLCLLAGCGSAARYTDGGYTPATTAATTAEEEISLCGTWKLNSTDVTFTDVVAGNSFLTLLGSNVDEVDENEVLLYLFEKGKVTSDMMTPVVKKFCSGLVLNFDERSAVSVTVDPEICRACFKDATDIIFGAIDKLSEMELSELTDVSVEELQKKGADAKQWGKTMRSLSQESVEVMTAENIAKTYENATLNANGMIEFPAVSYSQNGKYATIKDEKCSAVRNIKVVKDGGGARIADATITVGGEVEQFSAALILEKGMRLERVSA